MLTNLLFLGVTIILEPKVVREPTLYRYKDGMYAFQNPLKVPVRALIQCFGDWEPIQYYAEPNSYQQLRIEAKGGEPAVCVMNEYERVSK